MKFSDDTGRQGPQSDHGHALTDFVRWCDDNFFDSKMYQGTIFDNQLKRDLNTDAIVKRGQQKIHLCKQNSFSVSPVIFCHFYQPFIENLLTFSFISA